MEAAAAEAAAAGAELLLPAGQRGWPSIAARRGLAGSATGRVPVGSAPYHCQSLSEKLF